MNKTNALWRPWDPENIRDPYPMYERLRKEDPVHQSQTGEWIITRYEDARNLLRDPELAVGNRLEWIRKSSGYLQKKGLDFSSIEKVIQHFILLQNPPDHTRIRKFIHQAWNNHDVGSIILDNINHLLGRAGNDFDFVDQVAKPLPAMTISKILGLPTEDYIRLKEWGSDLVRVLDLYISLKEIEKIDRAAKEFSDYFDKVIVHKKEKPDNGVISKLIALNQADGTLSDAELLSTCILLFIAGEETSVGLLGTGLYNLILNPGQLDTIRDDLSLLPAAIEELIRHDGPVQVVGRFASRDLKIADKLVPSGSTLTICLGSANRDAEQFENPANLNIRRNPNRHLGFGAGIHYCMGDWLARLQTKIALEAILNRYERIEVSKDVEWSPHLSIRTLRHLVVSGRQSD